MVLRAQTSVTLPAPFNLTLLPSPTLLLSSFCTFISFICPVRFVIMLLLRLYSSGSPSYWVLLASVFHCRFYLALTTVYGPGPCIITYTATVNHRRPSYPTNLILRFAAPRAPPEICTVRPATFSSLKFGKLLADRFRK